MIKPPFLGKLVSIGDCVVDHYLEKNLYYPGGNALNVAVLVRRFGLETSFYIGMIGSDEEGRHIRASMKSEGIADDYLRQVEGESGKAKVTLENGDRVFVGSNKGGVQRRLMLRMDEADMALITKCRHVHSSCYSALEAELPRIRARAAHLSFDFSTRWQETRDDMSGDDYLALVCPHITCAFLSGSELDFEAAQALIARIHGFGVGFVCITQGEKGALYSEGQKVHHQPIQPAKLVDTMGAGDAFIAGFLAASLGGAKAAEAITYAAFAAARACEWAGAFGHPHQAN